MRPQKPARTTSNVGRQGPSSIVRNRPRTEFFELGGNVQRHRRRFRKVGRPACVLETIDTGNPPVGFEHCPHPWRCARGCSNNGVSCAGAMGSLTSGDSQARHSGGEESLFQPPRPAGPRWSSPSEI